MKNLFNSYRTPFLILIAISCMPSKAMNFKAPRTPRQKVEKVELAFRQQKDRKKAILTTKRAHARKRFGYKLDLPIPQPAITMTNMTYDEMKHRKNELLAIDTAKNTKSKRYLFKIRQQTANNKQIAAKYIDRMVKMCDDPNDLADLLIELGDIQFDIGELRKAEASFKEFIDLYPGHKQIEYAYYKGLLCAYYHTLSYDRDQTATYDTIRLSEQFLERVDLFIEYQDEVKKIRKQCYQKLIDSEFNVCTYYLNRSNIKGVENRLEVVRSQFLSEVPEVESQLVAFESKLASKREELIAGQQKKEESLITASQSAHQVIAQETSEPTPEIESTPKESFAQRF